MFQGSIAALITPFLSSGEIDSISFRSLVRWQIEEKTDALVICGTTGESPTLTHEEQIYLFKMALDESKGKIPIIAGTGCNDTRMSVIKTREAKALGAHGCLAVFPYYNRPTFEGCYEHFKQIADEGLPIIVYHHPGRTGIQLTAKQLAEISQIPGVVNIKETSSDVSFGMEVMRYTSTPLLSGDDMVVWPLIAGGAKGVISVIANVIPKQWKEFVTLALEGDMRRSRDLNNVYARLCKAMALETNPQCIKYAVSLLKRCEAHLRLPLLEPKPFVKEEIAKALHGILWESALQENLLPLSAIKS